MRDRDGMLVLILAIVLVALALIFGPSVYGQEADPLKPTLSVVDPPADGEAPNTDIMLNGCTLHGVVARDEPPFWVRILAYCPGRLSTAWLATERTAAPGPGTRAIGPAVGGSVLGGEVR